MTHRPDLAMIPGKRQLKARTSLESVYASKERPRGRIAQSLKNELSNSIAIQRKFSSQQGEERLDF